MIYQLRKSEQENHYYLVEIDKDNNEKVLIDGALDLVQTHPKASKLKPIDESETRATIENISE
jgi:hypothetical protein